MTSDAKTPQDYIDSLPAERKVAMSKLRQVILDNLPEGFSEIMCHPGLVDATLREISDYAEERGYELSLLTESGLPGLLAAREIQLGAYAQLNV